MDLLASGGLKIAPMISHRFPIEKAAEAYEIITGKKKKTFLGVLLTYPVEAAPGSQVVRTNVQTPQRDNLVKLGVLGACLLYTSPSPRDRSVSRMPSSA